MSIRDINTQLQLRQAKNLLREGKTGFLQPSKRTGRYRYCHPISRYPILFSIYPVKDTFILFGQIMHIDADRRLHHSHGELDAVEAELRKVNSPKYQSSCAAFLAEYDPDMYGEKCYETDMYEEYLRVPIAEYEDPFEENKQRPSSYVVEPISREEYAAELELEAQKIRRASPAVRHEIKQVLAVGLHQPIAEEIFRAIYED